MISRTDKSEEFLSRWSRLKSKAREDTQETNVGISTEDLQTESAVDDRAIQPAAKDALDDGRRDQIEEVVERDESEFSHIDFETLDYQSDYTQFMQKDVPERIRRRALRALWNSDPVFANLDGLNDYDEDFTDAALAVDVLESAWKVGRGYMTDEDETADAEGTDSEKEPEKVETPVDVVADAHRAESASSKEGAESASSKEGAESASSKESAESASSVGQHNNEEIPSDEDPPNEKSAV